MEMCSVWKLINIKELTSLDSSSVFRAVVNLLESHSYLMEVDTRLVRSCLYVMSFDVLLECVIDINAELLDTLHIFTNKLTQEITCSNFQVKNK